MLEEFERYLSSYNLDQSYMKLNHDHSIRVMELMIKYAKLLNFNGEDIEIARIIGLLHDIGRFEQYKEYGSDIDYKTIDHADYSVVQLFDKGEIELFTKKKEWYPIIKFAIKNHNKREISECFDERVLKFTKLIRDVDKLDIIYLLGYLGEYYDEECNFKITEEVRQYVMRHETVDVTKCQNTNDRLVAQFAFVFDINNDVILDEYKNNLRYFYDRVDKDRFKEIYEEVIRYIDERIDKYERNRN